MLESVLPPQLEDVLFEVKSICESIVAPLANDVDSSGAWPVAAMGQLQNKRITGLTAPTRVGGHGMGLLAIASVTEMLGAACASTAMCFGMHCVATAVIAARADNDKDERYLRPIAEGRHLTTLALSEAGTGSFFFMPETELTRDADTMVANGVKQFVTNGGQADSYVVSTLASVPAPGDFSCLVVDRDTPGVIWGECWSGIGMRGNSSRSMTLENVRLPHRNLLGEEGDQAWFVFEVVAPFFLMAMAATYLGVAQAALNIAMSHLKARRHTHSATLLADSEIIQHRVGELWTDLQKSRLLLYHAAKLGDAGHPDALGHILAAKADAAHAVVKITNEAMSLCGGIAYRENSTLSRLLRDARASHVMSPTTEMLTLWTGRSALGLPLI